MSNREKAAYVLVALLCITHFLIGHFAPKEPSPYDFGPLFTIILGLTITVPYYLTWFMGVYAGMTLSVTVPNMAEREDKIAFSRLSTGVFLLTFGLIATSMISSVRAYFASDAAFVATNTIISNYAYILGPLLGFTFMYSGSKHLRSASSARLSSFWTFVGVVMVAMYAAVYLWLVFTNETRQFSSTPGVAPSYYLPDFLVVTTIVVPFFASLVLSLLAVVHLTQYYRGVSGLIYKKSAMNFILGSLFVIGGSNLLMTLLSIGTVRLRGLSVPVLLLIIYLFLGLTAFGFLYLALGARKLAIIERVMRKYDIKDVRV